MVNKIATRIQSRLSRKGIKITLGDIKTVYSQMVADDQNPTDAEVDQVTEYFISQSSKLATGGNETTEEELAPVPTETTGNDQGDNLEAVHNLYTDVNNTVDNQLDALELVLDNNLDTTLDKNLDVLDNEQEETPGAIALKETSDLVSQTAESMGITLNLEDISAIASNFDQSSTNSDSELEEIRDAIVSFVQHKSQITQQKISNIVEEVRETIHNLDAENSQHLNDGLRSISQDIQSGSERFRQQTRQALKVFALPPSKAG